MYKLVSVFVSHLLLLALALGCSVWCSTARAGESAVGRLSGFDLGKIAALAPWCEKPLPKSDPTADSAEESKAGVEVAKFLYQVRRFSRGGLDQDSIPPIDDPALDVGDLAKLNGEVLELSSWPVPADMAEPLEMSTIYRVLIKTADGKQSIVFTAAVPSAWLKATDDTANQPLHRTNGSGVVIRAATEQRPAILATSALAWMVSGNDQSSQVPADWRYLSDKGLDLTVLETVRGLDRKSLQAEDNGPFYSLLRIAADIGNLDSPNDLPLQASPEPPVDLLKQSKRLVGRYIKMDLQTIRVTRVRISDEDTKTKVGSDSYWQVDCVGDLGNVVVKIANGSAEPAIFENRYPVSIVVRDLPPFLERQALASVSPQGTAPLAAEQVDTAMVSTQITVDGFFYRLWSYESKFMDQHGGGEQFGPLVIAARVIDHEPPHTDSLGVNRIGWFIAIIAGAVILSALIGGWLSARNDAAAKRRQRDSLPDQFPQA